MLAGRQSWSLQYSSTDCCSVEDPCGNTQAQPIYICMLDYMVTRTQSFTPVKVTPVKAYTDTPQTQFEYDHAVMCQCPFHTTTTTRIINLCDTHTQGCKQTQWHPQARYYVHFTLHVNCATLLWHLLHRTGVWMIETHTYKILSLYHTLHKARGALRIWNTRSVSYQRHPVV